MPMKGYNAVLVETVIADAALTEFQAVVQGASDGHGTNPSGAGVGKFVGVTIDAASAGDTAPVVQLGTVWVQAAGAISAGDYVGIANAQGQLQTAYGNTIGIALSTTTSAGDYVLVYLSPSASGTNLKKVSGTTNATAGTQDAIPHGLGYAPSIVLITNKSNGVVYESQAADATDIYVTGSAVSLNFDAFVG